MYVSILQMEKTEGVMVEPGRPVIFDLLQYSTSMIGYDGQTGIFTLNERNNRYLITWWVALQGTAGTSAVFGIVTDDGRQIDSSTTAKNGLLTGTAIVSTNQISSLSFSLQNTGAHTVFYAAQSPVKAGISIVSNLWDPAFGARYLFGQDSITLDASPVPVPLNTPSPFSNVLFNVPNAISIQRRGIYRVDAVVSGSAQEPSLVTLGVAKNDTTQTLEFSTADTGTFCLSGFVELAQADQLTLLMSVYDGPVMFFFPTGGAGPYLSVQMVSCVNT